MQRIELRQHQLAYRRGDSAQAQQPGHSSGQFLALAAQAAPEGQGNRCTDLGWRQAIDAAQIGRAYLCAIAYPHRSSRQVEKLSLCGQCLIGQQRLACLLQRIAHAAAGALQAPKRTHAGDQFVEMNRSFQLHCLVHQLGQLCGGLVVQFSGGNGKAGFLIEAVVRAGGRFRLGASGIGPCCAFYDFCGCL